MEKIKKFFAETWQKVEKFWAKVVKFCRQFWAKVVKFWYFTFNNPVIAKGGAGGFKWVFRRYYLTLSTLSGNWSMRITAGEHPYGYLLYGVQKGDDNNIHGFAATLYSQAMMLTKDQRLVNDVQSAIKRYDKRVEAEGKKQERYDEAALEAVKQEQEFIELPKKERRKVEREINGRFKKVVKNERSGR